MKIKKNIVVNESDAVSYRIQNLSKKLTEMKNLWVGGTTTTFKQFWPVFSTSF